MSYLRRAGLVLACAAYYLVVAYGTSWLLHVWSAANSPFSWSIYAAFGACFCLHCFLLNLPEDSHNWLEFLSGCAAVGLVWPIYAVSILFGLLSNLRSNLPNEEPVSTEALPGDAKCDAETIDNSDQFHDSDPESRSLRNVIRLILLQELGCVVSGVRLEEIEVALPSENPDENLHYTVRFRGQIVEGCLSPPDFSNVVRLLAEAERESAD